MHFVPFPMQPAIRNARQSKFFGPNAQPFRHRTRRQLQTGRYTRYAACGAYRSPLRPRSRAAACRQTTVMMPVGVPRVPYRTPRENTWQWIDIWNCLYRERIIFLNKALDDETGNQIVATMLYLDSVDKKDLNFYINCAGGEVVPTLAIHDCMKHVKSECGTVGFGGCMGMSGFLLAVGKKGKRRLLPNTRLMIHHPSGAARGQASDIHNEARELLYLRDYITAILSEATGRPFEEVLKDFNQDKYFNAEEAVEYGLADVIVPPPKTTILDM